MSESAPHLTEDQIVDALAEALGELGLSASSQDTGGGISCVIVERKDGGEIIWGTADVTWGAAITNEEGEQVSSITTTWPSDSTDIAATARALLKPSIMNGATVSEKGIQPGQ
jgi:hypothetical protein